MIDFRHKTITQGTYLSSFNFVVGSWHGANDGEYSGSIFVGDETASWNFTSEGLPELCDVSNKLISIIAPQLPPDWSFETLTNQPGATDCARIMISIPLSTSITGQSDIYVSANDPFSSSWRVDGLEYVKIPDNEIIAEDAGYLYALETKNDIIVTYDNGYSLGLVKGDYHPSGVVFSASESSELDRIDFRYMVINNK